MPVNPDYVEQITDDEVIFRNYEGKRFTYKQPKSGNPVCVPDNNENPDIVPIEIAAAAGRARRKRKSANG